MADSVKLFKYKYVDGTVNAVVPKSSLLNELNVVNVAIDDPLINVKFGALVVKPPLLLVLPNVNVLATDIVVVNPPVPVYVNPVVVAMAKTALPLPPPANTMLFVPNAIDRVFELLELNV